jgi:hypothetical protein
LQGKHGVLCGLGAPCALGNAHVDEWRQRVGHGPDCAITPASAVHLQSSAAEQLYNQTTANPPKCCQNGISMQYAWQTYGKAHGKAHSEAFRKAHCAVHANFSPRVVGSRRQGIGRQYWLRWQAVQAVGQASSTPAQQIAAVQTCMERLQAAYKLSQCVVCTVNIHSFNTHACLVASYYTDAMSLRQGMHTCEHYNCYNCYTDAWGIRTCPWGFRQGLGRLCCSLCWGRRPGQQSHCGQHSTAAQPQPHKQGMHYRVSTWLRWADSYHAFERW